MTMDNDQKMPRNTLDVKGLGSVQKRPSSKAAATLARGAYALVREHDKGARTPLVAFFN